MFPEIIWTFWVDVSRLCWFILCNLLMITHITSFFRCITAHFVNYATTKYWSRDKMLFLHRVYLFIFHFTNLQKCPAKQYMETMEPTWTTSIQIYYNSYWFFHISLYSWRVYSLPRYHLTFGRAIFLSISNISGTAKRVVSIYIIHY